MSLACLGVSICPLDSVPLHLSCTCVYVSVNGYVTLGDWKKGSDLLELGVLHMGAGGQTWVFHKNSKYSLFSFLISRSSPRPHPPPGLTPLGWGSCLTEPGEHPARENEQVRTGIRAKLLAQWVWATHPLQNTVNNCLRTKVMITGCELMLWNCRVRGGTFPKKTSPMDQKQRIGQPCANFTSWQELLVSDRQGKSQPLTNQARLSRIYLPSQLYPIFGPRWTGQKVHCKL